jgi:hypothetical protein
MLDGALSEMSAMLVPSSRAAAARHAGLQRGVLHEAAAVQRELGNLRLRHDAAGDGAAELDVGHRPLHRHLLADAADLHRQVRDDVAPDFDDEVVTLGR